MSVSITVPTASDYISAKDICDDYQNCGLGNLDKLVCVGSVFSRLLSCWLVAVQVSIFVLDYNLPIQIIVYFLY